VLPLCSQTNSTEIEAVLEEKESQEEPIGLKIDKMQNGSSDRPETDNNMVQSVKSLQNHKQKLVGTSRGRMTDIEESAMYGNSNQCNEGIYTDSICISDADKVSVEVEEMVRKGFSMKDALLKAIRKYRTIVSNGELARGKNKKATGDVTTENILESKRKRQRVVNFNRIKQNSARSDEQLENLMKATDKYEAALAMQPEAIRPLPHRLKGGRQNRQKGGRKLHLKWIRIYIRKRKGKGKMVAKVGDLIYVMPEIFDDESGSYSKLHPERVFGTANSIDAKGIANITWVEDGSSNQFKLKDLFVAKPKRTVRTVVAGIIALLVKGKPIKKKKDTGFPKDFFEVLVREDWCKWVEAVKRELEAWDENNAVEVVDINEIPS
jgi:hypothetical protein